jgi:CBS domain-containing protein
MQVRDGMSSVVLTVNPGHTLREAACLMAERRVGAAVVMDPEQPGPGIVTERDVLRAIAAGEDPGSVRVEDHLSSDLTFAAPDWSLERAAEAMVRGGFRHLIVVDGSEMRGILSMRDIVRCWVRDGATSELPSDRDASRA